MGVVTTSYGCMSRWSGPNDDACPLATERETSVMRVLPGPLMPAKSTPSNHMRQVVEAGKWERGTLASGGVNATDRVRINWPQPKRHAPLWLCGSRRGHERASGR